jgi:hypothetical protein
MAKEQVGPSHSALAANLSDFPDMESDEATSLEFIAEGKKRGRLEDHGLPETSQSRKNERSREKEKEKLKQPLLTLPEYFEDRFNMDFGDKTDSDTASRNGGDGAEVQTLPVNLESRSARKRKGKGQSKQTALHSHSLRT